MSFEQQVKDFAQSAAQQIASQIEERLAGLAADVTQAASADRVSVVRELRLAADAEVAKRSQEAVAAAQDEHARRLEEAASQARQEHARRLDEALAAARAEAARRQEDALDALREELLREKDAAVGAVRAELSREHEAALASAHAEITPQIDAAVALVRADATRTMADALSRARAESDTRLAQAIADARRDAASSAERDLAEARAEERQREMAGMERLRDAIRRLDAARTLTDVLDALAETAGQAAPRVAVFVLRGARLTGWRHSGFQEDIDPSRLEMSVDHPGLLSRALRAGRAVNTSESMPGDEAFASPFGPLSDDQAALAVPVRIGGETVAIVYADDAVEGRNVPSAFPEVIEVLSCHAARSLEVLTLSRAQAQAQAQAQAVAQAQAQAHAQALAQAQAQAQAHAEALAHAQAQIQARRPAAAPPPVPPAAPAATAVAAPPPAPAAMAPLPSPPLPAPAMAAGPDAPPSPRYAPHTRSFQPTGDEDEDAARRYARLLVSEIKLYHEAAVNEGRRNRNLLERLRPEIERAQHLYEERVPVQVRLKGDFFGQELVRTLAGGDPTLLGAR
jgi:hypothetical protein